MFADIFPVVDDQESRHEFFSRSKGPRTRANLLVDAPGLEPGTSCM
jgi:hypothetical protein